MGGQVSAKYGHRTAVDIANRLAYPYYLKPTLEYHRSKPLLTSVCDSWLALMERWRNEPDKTEAKAVGFLRAMSRFNTEFRQLFSQYSNGQHTQLSLLTSDDRDMIEEATEKAERGFITQALPSIERSLASHTTRDGLYMMPGPVRDITWDMRGNGLSEQARAVRNSPLHAAVPRMEATLRPRACRRHHSRKRKRSLTRNANSRATTTKTTRRRGERKLTR